MSISPLATATRTVFATILLCVPAMLAQGNDPCATAPQTCATLIDTRAEAHTRIPNTAADVQIGISVTERDLSSAQRTLSEKSSQLLSYLRQQKVERLTTTMVGFAPDTKSQRNGPDRTVSFTGTSQVSFRALAEKVPDLLSGTLSNGGSSINSTIFVATEDDTATAQRKLAAEATRTALAEAETIAKAAGLHVVAVRTIGVNQTFGSPRPASPMMMAMKLRAPMAAMASPPIAAEAGDQELSVSVNAVVAAVQ